MSHEPVDLLILMLGTNDTKERFGSSAACIALGLKRLIAKAIAVTDSWRGAEPDILVVIPHLETNQIDFMHLTKDGHRQLLEALTKKVKEIFS